tara:strand:+ start:45 stop:440 length:396 start_codon:yes stop_codon:yes gene_type:complete
MSKEVLSRGGVVLNIGDKVELLENYISDSWTVDAGVTGTITELFDNGVVRLDIEEKNQINVRGLNLKKIIPSAFDKDLKELLQGIQYQTGYMTNSWGDTSMLSQMAIEDEISPWSIESDLVKFAKKYNIKL